MSIRMPENPAERLKFLRAQVMYARKNHPKDQPYILFWEEKLKHEREAQGEAPVIPPPITQI